MSGSTTMANNPVITCDDNHIYRADGVIVPGVTEVLSIFADYARVPRAVLENKRMIGRAVHHAIALYETDSLDPDSIDDSWVGFFEGWIKLKADVPGKVVASEQIVYHPKYRYAGRLDINYALEAGGLWQWDVKCVDKMSPATALQTSGYSEAWNEMHPYDRQITKRAGVQLCPDGSYVFHPYTAPTYRNDFNIFLNALAIRNWINNHGGK